MNRLGRIALLACAAIAGLLGAIVTGSTPGVVTGEASGDSSQAVYVPPSGPSAEWIVLSVVIAIALAVLLLVAASRLGSPSS